MAAALRALPRQKLPSEVVVPGLLEGLTNVSRLVAPWIEPGEQAVPARAISRIHCFASRICPEGLSAPLRGVHRPGDRGARAPRPRRPDRVAAPADRRPAAPGASRDPGSGALPAQVSLAPTPTRLPTMVGRPPTTNPPR